MNEKPQFRTTSPFYLIVFIVICIIIGVFFHLSTVYNISFFNMKNFAVIAFVIIILSLLVPKEKKLFLGDKAMPLMKFYLVAKTGSGNFENLENTIERRRMAALEQDKKIKSNPFLYWPLAILITIGLIVIIGFFVAITFEFLKVYE